jgi:hypothetical protein
MTRASCALVGPQHPVRQPLYGRFQSVVLAIFDQLAKLFCKRMRNGVRESFANDASLSISS